MFKPSVARRFLATARRYAKEDYLAHTMEISRAQRIAERGFVDGRNS